MQLPDVGDVLFFKAGKSFIDRAIIARIGGDVVHVAIVVTEVHIIQAVSGGIKLARIPDNYAYIARVGTALQKAKPERFEQARLGLLSLVGRRYGFGDIIDTILELLPGHPVISFDRSYDCSHLAAVWLDAAGYQLPFDTVTARITPADLKRILKPEVVQP